MGTFVSGLPVKHFWLPRKGLDRSGCAHLSDLGPESFYSGHLL